MDDDLEHLIEKIEKVLNEIYFYPPKELEVPLESGFVEVKTFAPTLCEALNKEGGFKDTWTVRDGQGVSTYLMYPGFQDFPIYSREHEKTEEPYFLIHKINRGQYKISLED